MAENTTRKNYDIFFYKQVPMDGSLDSPTKSFAQTQFGIVEKSNSVEFLIFAGWKISNARKET